LQKFTIDSHKEYLGHDTTQWQREYFNKENGGYLLVDRERTRQGSINKQERGKYEKELSMCQTLANNGYKVEYMKEMEGRFDIYLNGVAADLKKTASHNHIRDYAKKAVRKQGAELVLFEFEKETKGIYIAIDELVRKGIHGKYYFTGKTNKIYSF
jgi:hypothetical protein